MKEKRTYKRFDLLAGLAILGCIGMLLFECIFIFELYDRAALHSEASAQPALEVKVPAVSAAPVIEKAVAPETNAPPVTNVASPAAVPPAEIEKAPARREFVEPVEPVKPVVAPAG